MIDERLAGIGLRSRLMLGFGVILLLLAALTGIGIYQVNAIETALTRINDEHSQKQRHAIDFRGSVHDRAIALRDVVLVDSNGDVDDAVADIRALEAFYARAAGPLEAMIASGNGNAAAERRIVDEIKSIEARTLPAIEAVIALRRDGDATAAHDLLMAQARPAFVDWLAAINAFIDLQESVIQEESAAARDIAQGFQTLMLGLAALALLAGLVSGYWALRSLRPLQRLSRATRALADGDLSAEIPPARSRDEIGEITAAVAIFKQNAIEAKALEARQEAAEQQAEERQRAMMNRLADDFEGTIKSVVSTIAAASDQMESSAGNLSSIAEETNQQSMSVAAASEQASVNVETVASAAEELSGSIAEINRQVVDATRAANAAAAEADRTGETVEGLSVAAQRIGDVLKLIQAIAEQTNLLALNATIEAARAGEAGKGFAVVASEVKNLANQTAKATEEIATQISGMQNATGQAVTAIERIGASVARVNEMITGIASAAEQQGAATQEIARNVQEASSGTREVSSTIVGVTQAATETGAMATQVYGASSALTKQTRVLSSEVDSFIAKVREGA